MQGSSASARACVRGRTVAYGLMNPKPHGGPDGDDGDVTFYVEAALAEAESLGGTRMMMGPEEPIPGLQIGLFNDPEGHTIGVVKSAA